MRVTAIVVAAGPGSRLGAGLPKAFVPLAGSPLVIHALRAVLAAAEIDSVVVVAPPGRGSDIDSILARYGPWRCPIRSCPGGSERQDSVRAGVEKAGETDLVAIHDAARPFVDAAVVGEAVRVAAEFGAAIVAGRAADTVKEVDAGGRIVATLPRDRIWLAQTPQVFRVELLREAHEAARGSVPATDDALLLERAGVEVRVVEGNPENRKITTPADLLWAEWLLATRSGPR